MAKGDNQRGKGRAPKVKPVTKAKRYQASQAGAPKGKKVRRGGIWVWLKPPE